MSTMLPRTGERINPQDLQRSKVGYLSYLRHLFAYETAKSWIPQERHILEIGCGEGYGTRYLAECVDQIVGLDVDERVIAHASEQHGTERCIFQVFDGMMLPYPDAAFPMIISFQVIEHIDNDRAFLREIRRVLQPQGCCILATPNGAQRVQPGKRPWNRFHVREYTPDEFRAILQSVFSNVEIRGIRATEEIETLERSRIRQAQNVASFDVLNLKQYLPASVETAMFAAVKSLVNLFRSHRDTEDFSHIYTTRHYRLVGESLENSLDLLAICR